MISGWSVRGVTPIPNNAVIAPERELASKSGESEPPRLQVPLALQLRARVVTRNLADFQDCGTAPRCLGKLLTNCQVQQSALRVAVNRRVFPNTLPVT
jgi:hypothetical protein